MATAKATLVCIGLAERTAVPVPDAFREQIEAFQAEAT
jgi:acyl-CoA thioesterase FadM